MRPRYWLKGPQHSFIRLGYECKTKKYIVFAIGSVLGLACALLASAFFFENFRTGVANTFPTPECDVLMNPCASTLPTGEAITLSLSATMLPTMIPINIEVQTKDLLPLHIFVDFSGRNMFMGHNQPTLIRQERDLYVGKTVLPICSKSTMPWQATVYIDTERGRIAAPFRFNVTKPVNSLTLN